MKADGMAREVDEAPLRRLLEALPGPARRGYEAVMREGMRWVRLPLGVLLLVGGVLGFLPILGFWMVPLGLLVLSRDVPFLRGPTIRGLGVVQGWWDRLRGRGTG